MYMLYVYDTKWLPLSEAYDPDFLERWYLKSFRPICHVSFEYKVVKE